jgi:NAD(P)-dependent dehydrogenase (short-subunit alcohol dehydrogenase family)
MSGAMAGRVALVTGGSSGIGRATALAFAREGARVVVAADRNVEGGEETARLIVEGGGAATFVRADVSRAGDVEALVARAVDLYGRLDYAHNNAGVGQGGTATTAECSEEAWDRVLGINLKGVWLCLKYEIRQMLRQGGGAIVNTASAAGLIAQEGMPAYVASKHGVVGLTRAAALEYGRIGIRVNAVCPGYVQTPLAARRLAQAGAAIAAQHAMGRIGTPEEVAAAVVWLCSDAAGFVTGLAMPVDGGFTL